MSPMDNYLRILEETKRKADEKAAREAEAASKQAALEDAARASAEAFLKNTVHPELIAASALHSCAPCRRTSSHFCAAIIMICSWS